MKGFFILLIGALPLVLSSRITVLRVGGKPSMFGKSKHVTIFDSDKQIDFRELFGRERFTYELSLSLPYNSGEAKTTKPIPTSKPISTIMPIPTPSSPPSSIPSNSPSFSDASDDEDFNVNSKESQVSHAVKSTLIAVLAGAALIVVAALMARKFRRKNSFGKVNRVGGPIGDVFTFERGDY